MEYKISNVTEHQDILGYISENKGFAAVNDQILDGFTFTKFSLEELDLPSYEKILAGVLDIKQEIGLQGWTTDQGESNNYRGFSLTYNPDLIDKDVSINHQTWGSKNLTQIFSRDSNIGTHSQIKNTYYDSYGFRKRLSTIDKNLGFLLDKFTMTLLRSRVAFLNLYNRRPSSSGWHKDEYPYQLIRVLIPLQTSQDYILEINGEDEFGNSAYMTEHLSTGYAYLWNTRIPHRVGLKNRCSNKDDRIHLILGFSPWYDYVEESDSFAQSALYGLPISQIVNQKLFVTAK